MLRLKYIDSLRGIAALIVVIFHSIDIFFLTFNFGFSENKIIQLKMFARSFFSGSDWVSFFFVLSGFSLSLVYLKNEKEINLKKFYLKRFFRIYPLFLVVLILSYFFLHSVTSLESLLSQSLLFTFRNDLLPPSWSLSVEWIGSLLIPFFIVVFKYNRTYFYYLIFISLFLYNGIGESQSSFFGFMFNFLIGILLADLFLNHRLKPVKKYYLIIFPILFLSFSARWMIDFFPSLKYLIQRGTDFLNMDFHQFFYFLSAIGSFVLLYIILQSPKVQKILSNKIIIFLGTISFSIYLVHFLVIHLFFDKIVEICSGLGSELTQAMVSMICLITLVIFISTVSYFVIEKPFMDLVNKWNKKL